MDQRLIEYFEIPDFAVDYIDVYLTEAEQAAILLMGKDLRLPVDLEAMLVPITEDPAAFITRTYARGTFNKAEEDGVIYFVVANFYKRLAFFSQYESEIYQTKISADVRKLWDDWYVQAYADRAVERLELCVQGKAVLIENAFFYTLDETLTLVDRLEVDEFLLVPCNCRTVSLGCKETSRENFCLQFSRGINTEWDRGHGERISKEAAKELVRKANKLGLMQTTETETAICNCCGCCCFPIRASGRIGAKGIWPKRMYDVVLDAEACILCGQCVAVCNFDAFREADGEIVLCADKCWGCTLCKEHCPTGAIEMVRIGSIK